MQFQFKMMRFGAVPQRASKVAKSLDMIRKQDEFRLVDESDETDILDKPWKISMIWFSSGHLDNLLL